MDWNGGRDYGMDYGIFIKNEQFPIAILGSVACTAVYSLTCSQSALPCIGSHLYILPQSLRVNGHMHI